MKRQRFFAWFGMVLGTALAAGGCADDSPGGDAAGGTATGGSDSGTTEAPMVTTDAGADSSSGGMGGSADGSGSDGGTSSGGGVEVRVTGTVVDLVPPSAPIADAVISVFGDDTITATANAGGIYDIGPFEPNTWATMLVEPSNDYTGSVIAVAIGGAEEQEDRLAQISKMTIQDQIDGLEPQMPAEADLTQAIIVVRLISAQVLQDGPVTVTMDPAPLPDTFYAPDAAFAPVLNSSDLAFAGLPVVVYFNVAPDEPGAYTFTYEHDTATCSSVFADVPTIGEYITLIDVTCE